MARELLNSGGPELNDLGSWDFGVASAGWSIATSPAPTHGTYIFKGVSGSANGLQFGASTSLTPKTYVWLCMRGFRLTGTLSSGDDVRLLSLVAPGQTLNLHWIYETASTFKLTVLRSTTVILTSTNAFNVDQWYEIRVEFDGTNWTLWVDGTEEDEAAATNQPNDTRIILQKDTLSSGQEHYYRGLLLTHSDSESDRPGTAVENDRLDPDGDTAEDDALPNGLSGDPNDYQWWDDYVGGNAPDDDTTYLLFDSAAERKHVSTATTHTPTDNIEGIVWHLWARAAAATKTGNTHARIKEGSNASEVALSNFNLDSFVPKSAVFDLAPDGGAWTQSDVDALEVGLRSESGNGVNIRASALAVELISVDNDAPPAPPVGSQTIRKTVYY